MCHLLNVKSVNFTLKTKTYGSVDRYKVILFAKGYIQTSGVDYNETFSVAVRFDTLRAMFSTAATEKLELLQLMYKIHQTVKVKYFC